MAASIDKRNMPPLHLALPPTHGARMALFRMPQPDKPWSQMSDHPIELLRDIRQFLNAQNRLVMWSRQRLRLADYCLRYAVPALRSIYSDHYKGEAFPELPERREGLTAANDCCIQLAYAYKHVLRHDYRRIAARPRLRRRLEYCGFNIIALLRIEQRLRALRYQRLPAETWLDCNQIFYALNYLDAVDSPFNDIDSLRLHAQRPVTMVRRPAQVTLREHYIQIQLFGYFETNALGAHNLHLVDQHLKQDFHLQDGRQQSTGALLCFQDGAQAPAMHAPSACAVADAANPLARLARHDAEKMGLLWLDTRPLVEYLKAQLIKARLPFANPDPDDPGRTVISREDTARMLVVENLLSQLRPGVRAPRQTHSRNDNILVYSGFNEVFQLLAEYRPHAHETAVPGGDRALRDALAAASALIADAAQGTGGGRWLVTDDNAAGVVMITRETRFTNAMYIGQLIAYYYAEDSDTARPAVGYIQRLQRDQQGEVEVQILKLADYGESTVVQSAFLDKVDMGLPGILLRGADHGWLLLVHHSQRLTPGERIFVRRDGKRHSLVAGDMLHIQREFVIFALQSGREKD